jgi:hypothetical protein
LGSIAAQGFFGRRELNHLGFTGRGMALLNVFLLMLIQSRGVVFHGSGGLQAV